MPKGNYGQRHDGKGVSRQMPNYTSGTSPKLTSPKGEMGSEPPVIRNKDAYAIQGRDASSGRDRKLGQRNVNRNRSDKV